MYNEVLLGKLIDEFDSMGVELSDDFYTDNNIDIDNCYKAYLKYRVFWGSIINKDITECVDEIAKEYLERFCKSTKEQE